MCVCVCVCASCKSYCTRGESLLYPLFSTLSLVSCFYCVYIVYAVCAPTVDWDGNPLPNAFFMTRPKRSETSLILSICCLLADVSRSLLIVSASNVALAIDSNEYPFDNNLEVCRSEEERKRKRKLSEKEITQKFRVPLALWWYLQLCSCGDWQCKLLTILAFGTILFVVVDVDIVPCS